jgi:hypothetical protein
MTKVNNSKVIYYNYRFVISYIFHVIQREIFSDIKSLLIGIPWPMPVPDGPDAGRSGIEAFKKTP